MLKDPDSTVRAAAAAALSRLGDKRTVSSKAAPSKGSAGSASAQARASPAGSGPKGGAAPASKAGAKSTATPSARAAGEAPAPAGQVAGRKPQPPVKDGEQPPAATEEAARRIEQEFSRLDTGIYAFEPNRKMQVGRSEDVTLTVTRSVSEALARELAAKGLSDQTVNRVSPWMRASLSGADFEIDSSDAYGIKYIGEADRFEWTWRATPLSSGRKRLKVQVWALLRFSSRDSTLRPVKTLNRDIEVVADLGFSMRRGLSTLKLSVLLGILASLVTVIVGIYNLLAARKKKKLPTGGK
jgi:hypothetical protein